MLLARDTVFIFIASIIRIPRLDRDVVVTAVLRVARWCARGAPAQRDPDGRATCFGAELLAGMRRLQASAMLRPVGRPLRRRGLAAST